MSMFHSILFYIILYCSFVKYGQCYHQGHRMNLVKYRNSMNIYDSILNIPNQRFFKSIALHSTAYSDKYEIYDNSKSNSNRLLSIDSSNPMKLGVLLLNLGGPETMEDVEGFLYNLFADPDIIRLPSFLSMLQKPLAYVIAKRRAPKSSEAYKTIGGGSPIVRYTKEQASLIEDQLHKRGIPGAKCYFAMRYWNPYTEEVLEEIKRDGVNTLVIVPLYPQYSISTSGSSLKLLQDIFYKDSQSWTQDKILHTVVPAWYYRKGYIQAVAKLIVQEIKAIRTQGSSERKLNGHSHNSNNNIDRKDMDTENMISNPSSINVDVLFSAHGVPESYILAGDPYQQQIEECFHLVSSEVRSIFASESDPIIPMDNPSISPNAYTSYNNHDIATSGNISFHLSYQSRVGPVEWLKPYTEETIESLGRNGVKRLVVVPISFVSEHIETLEEIDMEYRDLAEENGIKYWRRVPALNTDESFIRDMTDMVLEALESPLLVLSEAVSPTLPSNPIVPTSGSIDTSIKSDNSNSNNFNRENNAKNSCSYMNDKGKGIVPTVSSTETKNTIASNRNSMTSNKIYHKTSLSDKTKSNPYNNYSKNKNKEKSFDPMYSVYSGIDDDMDVNDMDDIEIDSMSDIKAKKQFGISSVAETINGRFAMLGFLGTTVLELLYGHPVVHIMGLR